MYEVTRLYPSWLIALYLQAVIYFLFKKKTKLNADMTEIDLIVWIIVKHCNVQQVFFLLLKQDLIWGCLHYHLLKIGVVQNSTSIYA